MYVKFGGSGISHFTIEARHPLYSAAISRDETAPDFTACDQSHDPSFKFTPLDLILFEDADYRLVGHRYATFWRPENVDFRVGKTVTHGLHLVQLIRKVAGRPIEILVLYPSDGYWRSKPLPPAGAAETAYGSSFLVGPIREDGRPYVPISSVEFVRSDLSFHLRFASGDGVVRVMESSPRRTLVSVALPRSTGSSPWAALRSMFTGTAMADVAEATVDPGTADAKTSPILDLGPVDATAILFGRSVPSRHNTSAPDLEFGGFSP
ncbi:MAG TPA: hypothetical protein VH722_21925 [Alphaproteobacteria bacterium]|nr:hypothetical protein [Alphaproteobacteria bacterium]